MEEASPGDTMAADGLIEGHPAEAMVGGEALDEQQLGEYAGDYEDPFLPVDEFVLVNSVMGDGLRKVGTRDIMDFSC